MREQGSAGGSPGALLKSPSDLGREGERDRMKKTTVLIVLDDEKLKRTLEKLAVENGYLASGMKRAEKALDILRKNHDRVVLVTDVDPGGKAGIEFLRKMKGTYPHVPVIAMTGSAKLDSAAGALKLGAYDYITRPIEPDMFLHSLGMANEKLSLLREKGEAENKLKRIIQQLESKNEEVEKLSHFKSFMISMASHDLKTTLTVLTGYQKMLLETLGDKLSAEERKVVREGEKSLKRASLMIESLLDYHSVEMGTINLQRSEFIVEDVIVECVDFLGPYAEMKEITILKEISGNSLTAYGDRMKVIQILDNLITNAIKFVPPGGKITVFASKTADDKVKISVIDSGCGIPEEKISGILSSDPVIFKREGTGIVGLGLSICKKLVEVQEGRLSILSNPGRGTEISFILPTHGS